MVVSVSGYVFTCCCLGWRLDVWLNVFFTCCCLGGRLSVWLGIFLPVVVLVHGCQCVWVFSYLLLSWWLVVSVLGVFFFGLLLSWWEVVSVVGCVLTCFCLGERLSVWFKVFLPVVVWVGGCQCVFHLLLSLWIFVYFYLLLSWWVIVSVFFTVAVIVIFCLLELTCCCLGGFVCYLPVIVLWSFCLFFPVVVWVCFYLSLSLWSFVYFSLPVVVWVCFYLSLSLWSFVYFSFTCCCLGGCSSGYRCQWEWRYPPPVLLCFSVIILPNATSKISQISIQLNMSAVHSYTSLLILN